MAEHEKLNTEDLSCVDITRTSVNKEEKKISCYICIKVIDVSLGLSNQLQLLLAVC